MAITPEAPGQISPPNTLTGEAVGVVAAPNTLTGEAVGVVAAPNTLVGEAVGAVAAPNTLVGEAVGSVSAPNTLVGEAVGSVSAPNTLVGVTPAAFPRTLTPLVDMNFATKSYAQSGTPVAFDDLFTYSRASSATFTNRVAKATGGYDYFLDTDYVGDVENLLTYSEQFDNAAWSKSNVSVTANMEIAPDGTFSADRYTENNALSYKRLSQSLGATLNATPHVFSIQIKAAGRKWVLIWSDNLGKGAYFNISTGTLGTDTSDNGASIVNKGNGWYECSISNIMDGVADQPSVYLALENGNANYQGDGTSGVYIWGAQLTESAKPLPYVKTINAPVTQTFTETLRTEYDAATGEALGALIEGGSTNLVTRSEEFDNAAWVKSNAIVTPNSISAPDGTISGDLVSLSTFTAQIKRNMTVTALTQYTLSFYVKKGTATDLKYSVYDFTNLADIISPTSYFSEIGTDWTRVSLTFTTPVGCVSAAIYPVRDSAATGTLYIWGAQLETLPFASSYIRTEGAAVSRSGDNLSLPSAGNFSDILSTVHVKSNINGLNAASRYNYAIGTGSERVYSLINTENISFRIQKAGITSVSVVGAFPTGGALYTSTIAYSNTEANGYVNKLNVGADTSVLIPTLTGNIYIGTNTSIGEHLFGHISKFATYDKALTAQEITLL